MLMIPSLTLNAVKSWLLPHKILRMAKFEETSTHQYLVMGGLYRLVKCKSTAKVWAERVRITSLAGDWCWHETQFMPSILLQSWSVLNDNVFKIQSFVLNAWWRDIRRLGVHSLSAPIHADRKRVFDLLPIADRRKLTSLLTASRIFISIYHNDSVVAGSKHLTTHLWHFVNRRDLSLYLKIHQTSLSSTSFDEVMKFSKLKFDRDVMEQNSVWLPWLKTVPHKQLSAPNLLSFDGLKPWLPNGLSKNKVRKINQYSRKLQSSIISAYKTREYSPLHNLSVINALKGFPVSIALNVLGELDRDLFGRAYWLDDDHEQENSHLLTHHHTLIVRAWATYFAPMVGRVKPRKQRAQWERAIDQLKDVLTWHSNIWTNTMLLHKNQHWAALVRQHDLWVEHINQEHREFKYELETVAIENWLPATLDAAFITKYPNTIIEEITQPERLKSEGIAMDHCVWAYRYDCSSARYRVFSLQADDGRYTLGLYMDRVSRQCSYDQLRGARNSAAPALMHEMANKLIAHINAQERAHGGSI